MQEIQMSRKAAAYKIHMDIMAAGEVASEAFSTFCRLLKTMRDDKLYTELEYSSFEAYCENAVGLKQRQAYNYIKAYENFGEENLQSIAKLGIRKLELIGAAPEESRGKLLEDAKEMTSREVEAAVKEYKTKLSKAEDEIKKSKELAEKQSRYADEHMKRAREAEYKLEKQETSINALRLDLDNARKQLADAKGKGDTDKIKRLETTVVEQVNKLEELEEENERLQKQLKDRPIEVAATQVKEIIPDEVALAVYNKVCGLYEGLCKLTPKEIEIFANQVDPDYYDDINGSINLAINILNELDKKACDSVYKADIPSCNVCGACSKFETEHLSDDEVEAGKGFCNEHKKIVPSGSKSCSSFDYM